ARQQIKIARQRKKIADEPIFFITKPAPTSNKNDKKTFIEAFLCKTTDASKQPTHRNNRNRLKQIKPSAFYFLS
ncbi:MAG: hypothetical protein RRZ65_04275, partial [Tannerellaceae bacterium]